MKRLWMMMLFLSVAAYAAKAQETPRIELFAGYQYSHADKLLLPDRGLHGWNASLSANANRWFGIESDFSGTYAGDSRLHTFMGGPRFTYRATHVTPFAHVLFGGAVRSALSNTDTAVAMAAGGGLDINISKHVAVRVAQFDYLLTAFSSETQGNWRYSGGFVFRFGK